MKNKTKHKSSRLNPLIHFFRLHRKDPGNSPTSNDIQQALAQLSSENCKYKLDNGDFLSFVDKSDNGVIKYILTTQRRFWSKVQEGSELLELQLQNNQELTETTHLVMFDDGYIAAEFNIRGPKVSQFESFVNEKCPEFGRLKFATCIEPDTAAQINRAKYIKKIKLKLWRADMDGISKDSNIKTALANAMDQFDSDNIEIVINNPKSEASHFFKKAMDVASGLVGYQSENPQHQPKMSLNAVDEKGDHFAINLLKSQISLRKTVTIPDDGSRYIQPEVWFQAIIDEKNRLQETLDRATYLL